MADITEELLKQSVRIMFLPKIDAVFRGDDGSRLQHTVRHKYFNAGDCVLGEKSIRVDEAAIFIGSTNILYVFRHLRQGCLVTHNEHKRIAAHTRITFPPVVVVTIIKL